MKHVGFVILRVKDPIIQYNDDQTLVPKSEHYSHYHLLFQRDVLTLYCEEDKAHYNTLQDFYKLHLYESCLPKSMYNEL